jgi:6,7-dimethyl-8-ribityllumazine synthase
VLGAVIRGETDHYDHVARTAMDAVSDLTMQYSLAVGNGILTTENKEQAMERARTDRRNLGAAAAKSCLRMIDVKRELGL